MESSLIIDAFVLVAALEADLGRHRKIGPWRILRPLFAGAAIIPLFLKAVTTTGAGLYLEIALAGACVALGLAATALMSVYRSPGTGRAVSRSAPAGPSAGPALVTPPCGSSSSAPAPPSPTAPITGSDPGWPPGSRSTA